MEPQKYVVEYNSNNSGGGWWLEDADWKTLEDAGWTVAWLGDRFCNSEFSSFTKGGKPAPNIHETRKCPGHRGADSYEEAIAADKDARFLGAIASSATIEVEAYSSSLAEGVAAEWWSDTLGKNPDEEGCNCCGRPHSFYAWPVKEAAA